MERRITVKTGEKEAEVVVKVLSQECQSCLFLYGEMAVLLKELNLSDGKFQATASCNFRGLHQKHIKIEINADHKHIDSDWAIAHWSQRQVHCNL